MTSFTTSNRIMSHHAPARRAQRDPHGDLAGARRDHQSDDSVNAERGQRQDHAASAAGDGRPHQEVAHAVLPQPHAGDDPGIGGAVPRTCVCGRHPGRDPGPRSRAPRSPSVGCSPATLRAIRNSFGDGCCASGNSNWARSVLICAVGKSPVTPTMVRVCCVFPSGPNVKRLPITAAGVVRLQVGRRAFSR